jgi:hypothetical protein
MPDGGRGADVRTRSRGVVVVVFFAGGGGLDERSEDVLAAAVAAVSCPESCAGDSALAGGCTGVVTEGWGEPARA